MLSRFNVHKFLLSSRKFHKSSFCFGNYTEVKESNGIREIKMIDGKTRNSLSLPMMTEILQEINKESDNKSLRVIIISSSLQNIFSAGHNLKEIKSLQSVPQCKEIFSKLSDIYFAIRTVPVPVVAKVDGLAAAAGCQLVSSCDIVIASKRASFSLPGADVGIFCSTPGVAVSRIVPRMKSSFMLLTGLPISADQAYVSGIVSSVVSNEQLEEETERICSSIIRKSRAVVALGKDFYNKQFNMDIATAFKLAEDVMVKNLSCDDGKEGIQSFIEKRRPNWRNS